LEQSSGTTLKTRKKENKRLSRQRTLEEEEEEGMDNHGFEFEEKKFYLI